LEGLKPPKVLIISTLESLSHCVLKYMPGFGAKLITQNEEFKSCEIGISKVGAGRIKIV
jgi:hypothetical protein